MCIGRTKAKHNSVCIKVNIKVNICRRGRYHCVSYIPCIRPLQENNKQVNKQVNHNILASDHRHKLK